jgi:hypothetical protein
MTFDFDTRAQIQPRLTKQMPAVAGTLATELSSNLAGCIAALTFIPDFPETAFEYPGASPAVHGPNAAVIYLRMLICERAADAADGQRLGFLDAFHGCQARDPAPGL